MSEYSDVSRQLTYWTDEPNVIFARNQGRANFSPSMVFRLPELECPYTTPLYREAWYRGLYDTAWALVMSMLIKDISPHPGGDDE